MKKILSFLIYVFLIPSLGFAGEQLSRHRLIPFAADYETTVTFPAGYSVGDYVEFARVIPIDAGASGNYEISISYTRGNIAAAATHLASISHANPNIWREAGRVNNNAYLGSAINFTIDCNGEYAYPRFRIRAINTNGVLTNDLAVHITIHPINFNAGYTALSTSGNDQTVSTFVPMTNDWSLYVGNSYLGAGANLAIKALINGNVGIGISNPTEKLAVNGNIRAKEIKVETANWPDYVFENDYKLLPLEAVKTYIDLNGHLPEIPSKAVLEKEGLNLGEMNRLLTQKIEELTLYLLQKDEQLKTEQQINLSQQELLKAMQKQLNALSSKVNHSIKK